jgi:adenosine deaminase
MLRAVDEHGPHPIQKLLDEGCRVSLATDDPAFFLTSPQGEAELAASRYGISASCLWQMLYDSVEMAFCSASLKEKFLGLGNRDRLVP